jgi:hypothetical protein
MTAGTTTQWRTDDASPGPDEPDHQHSSARQRTRPTCALAPRGRPRTPQRRIVFINRPAGLPSLSTAGDFRRRPRRAFAGAPAASLEGAAPITPPDVAAPETLSARRPAIWRSRS